MKQVSVKVPSRSIGLDLSDEKSSFCMIDGRGRITREGQVETEAASLRGVFGKLDASRIILEASPQCHWVAKLLRSFGHEVIVINPRRLQLISESASKTDRNDARMLARVGRLDVGMLQPVHEKSDATLAVRMEMRARTQLIAVRTRLINIVRSDLKTLGQKAPSCGTDAFHKKVRIPEILRAALEPLLRMLAALQVEIERYDEAVANQCDRHTPTGVFRQIHGVGPVLSLAYVMAIEDPKRFKSSRLVGAYFGLTPKSFQSGKSDPCLRISKQGDRAVRSLLVTAATHILKRSAPDSDLKRHGRRIARSGTKRDKARARVAVARKLAVLMHRLWATGEVYEPLRSSQAA
jgi:transposase